MLLRGKSKYTAAQGKSLLKKAESFYIKPDDCRDRFTCHGSFACVDLGVKFYLQREQTVFLTREYLRNAQKFSQILCEKATLENVCATFLPVSERDYAFLWDRKKRMAGFFIVFFEIRKSNLQANLQKLAKEKIFTSIGSSE